MPATSISTARVLRLAASAPGPRSAAEAICQSANADPSDAAQYLTRPARTALMGRENALALWHGPRGHYIRGIGAAALCRDRTTLEEIGERDRRKFVSAVVANRQRPATPPQYEPNPGSALVRTVVTSAHLSEAFAAELVGTDRHLDTNLAHHANLTQWPVVLHALIEPTPSGTNGSDRTKAIVARPDFLEIVADHDFVPDLMLEHHRNALGEHLAARRGLPLRIYEKLAGNTRTASTLYRDAELAALAGNPDVPVDLLVDLPATDGHLRPLGRMLGARCGDDPAAMRLTIQLVSQDADTTVGELVDAVAAATSPAHT